MVKELKIGNAYKAFNLKNKCGVYLYKNEYLELVPNEHLIILIGFNEETNRYQIFYNNQLFESHAAILLEYFESVVCDV